MSSYETTCRQIEREGGELIEAYPAAKIASFLLDGRSITVKRDGSTKPGCVYWNDQTNKPEVRV